MLKFQLPLSVQFSPARMGLFYLEEMRIAEIAVALDTAPGTIKTRLMHARNKLRARLEGETS